MLCGELLREAEKLIDARVHPQTIAAGWRLAAKLAKAELEKAATRETNEEKFRERLMEIARTTLSSKLVLYEKEHFAKLAVDAVLRLKGSDNLDYIQLLKKPGGQLGDSYLAEGFVLDKKIGIGQPKRLEKAKVMVANTAMDTDKIKIYGARVKVDSLSKVAAIEQAEKDKMVLERRPFLYVYIYIFMNTRLAVASMASTRTRGLDAVDAAVRECVVPSTASARAAASRVPHAGRQVRQNL